MQAGRLIGSGTAGRRNVNSFARLVEALVFIRQNYKCLERPVAFADLTEYLSALAEVHEEHGLEAAKSMDQCQRMRLSGKRTYKLAPLTEETVRRGVRESKLAQQQQQRKGRGNSSNSNMPPDSDDQAQRKKPIICNRWNRSGACNRSCTYKHRCGKCGGKHTRTKCNSV